MFSQTSKHQGADPTWAGPECPVVPPELSAGPYLMALLRSFPSPQAGNKGLLTYNNAVGIPGYTGFMPSTNALALPVKGFEHTGRPAASAEVEKLTVKSVDPRKTSQ